MYAYHPTLKLRFLTAG